MSDSDHEDKAPPANRTESGQFKKGVSGNPKGRPRVVAEFQAKCRTKSPKALRTLLANLQDAEGPVRNKAAELILAYAWGKPTQDVKADISFSALTDEQLKAKLDAILAAAAAT